MKEFSRNALKQAEGFLVTQARPLEQALFAKFIRNGPSDWALSELAAFQNSDGGFGHGLEPDLQLSDSNILATTVALQQLRGLQVSSDHPMVLGVMHYLMETYDGSAMAWPFVPPQVDDAPHAPWWQYSSDLTQYLANPRAEIVCYLFDYAGLVPEDLREKLLTAVIEYLENLSGQLSMHDLLCYVRLVETKNLPDGPRDRLLSLLQPQISSGVETDPTAWEGYGLRPLMVAPSASSIFSDLLQQSIDENLDFEIEQQQGDGSWSPSWSWGDSYKDAWLHAKRAWKGVLTVNMVISLSSYGRIESL